MITENDPEKVRRAMTAYAVFNFAWKAFQHAIEEKRDLWQIIEAVATGEFALTGTATELVSGQGPMLPAIREAYARSVQDTVKRDRQIAQQLVQAREGFFIPGHPE